eukprot:1627596-Lingulodinium_polyedra.AAC.1
MPTLSDAPKLGPKTTRNWPPTVPAHQEGGEARQGTQRLPTRNARAPILRYGSNPTRDGNRPLAA